eukprot:4267283-Alexandrium_andersonii.AAC.1
MPDITPPVPPPRPSCMLMEARSSKATGLKELAHCGCFRQPLNDSPSLAFAISHPATCTRVSFWCSCGP